MIHKKKQDVEDVKAYCSCKNFGASWIIISMFFGICQMKKKKKNQRKSSTLKHALVNNKRF